MTTADLVEHRLSKLEERADARDVRMEALILQVDRVTGRVDDHVKMLAKLEGKLDERDRMFEKSLNRLHERLDERLIGVAHGTDIDALRTELAKLSAEELREEGARTERRRLWRAWWQITGATVTVLGLLVAGASVLVDAL